MTIIFMRTPMKVKMNIISTVEEDHLKKIEQSLINRRRVNYSTSDYFKTWIPLIQSQPKHEFDVLSERFKYDIIFQV